jgi:cytochrome b pre-mRNA-processing protein 3
MNRLMRYLGIAPKANAAVVDALFASIVAAARQQPLYARFGVPDTPLGRFEMLSLHMGLVLRATRGADGAVRDLTQTLTEEFFKDVDHSLRELGIGDTGVPKRMKKLASMFYGRVDAYARAIDEKDGAALAAALERNVTPDGKLADAAGLAAYAFGAADAAERSVANGFLDGRLAFGTTGMGEAA